MPDSSASPSPPTPARSAHAPGLSLRAGVSAPIDPARFRVAAFDMDSTLITIECIDEIAALSGRGSEVAAITEAAMRGEISDYAESLRRRLELLRGVPAEVLDRVWNERLQLSEGALELTAALRARGLGLLVVSGGFSFFTDRLRERLGLDRALANVLRIEGGLLTGEVVGPIVDAQAKAEALRAFCAERGCTPAEAIAVGDGANDLAMMAAAGLSVAYRAKPRVREVADVAIDEGGLDRLLEVFEPGAVR